MNSRQHVIVAALVFLAAGALLPAGPLAAPPRRIAFQTRTMGTVATLTLVATDSAAVANLAYRALLSLHHTDSLLTNWTRTSETARINRLAGSRTVTLDPEANRVLTIAGRVGRDSDGAFDITVEPLVRLWGFIGGRPQVPDPAAIAEQLQAVGWQKLAHDPDAGTIRFLDPHLRLDLGGVAKGYGVDRVAEILRDALIDAALIDLSGNMVAIGAPPGRAAWTLGVMDPGNRDRILGRIALGDEAVATSGNYLQYVMDPDRSDSKRYGHILDPRTGWPAEGMASATVIAPDAATADAWATALIVLPPSRARELARRHAELKVVLVTQPVAGRRTIWVEEALRGRFSLPGAAQDTIGVRYF